VVGLELKKSFWGATQKEVEAKTRARHHRYNQKRRLEDGSVSAAHSARPISLAKTKVTFSFSYLNSSISDNIISEEVKRKVQRCIGQKFPSCESTKIGVDAQGSEIRINAEADISRVTASLVGSVLDKVTPSHIGGVLDTSLIKDSSSDDFLGGLCSGAAMFLIFWSSKVLPSLVALKEFDASWICESFSSFERFGLFRIFGNFEGFRVLVICESFRVLVLCENLEPLGPICRGFELSDSSELFDTFESFESFQIFEASEPFEVFGSYESFKTLVICESFEDFGLVQIFQSFELSAGSELFDIFEVFETFEGFELCEIFESFGVRKSSTNRPRAQWGQSRKPLNGRR